MILLPSLTVEPCCVWNGWWSFIDLQYRARGRQRLIGIVYQAQNGEWTERFASSVKIHLRYHASSSSVAWCAIASSFWAFSMSTATLSPSSPYPRTIEQRRKCYEKDQVDSLYARSKFSQGFLKNYNTAFVFVQVGICMALFRTLDFNAGVSLLLPNLEGSQICHHYHC